MPLRVEMDTGCFREAYKARESAKEGREHRELTTAGATGLTCELATMRSP
jgi:hypothetical protein